MQGLGQQVLGIRLGTRFPRNICRALFGPGIAKPADADPVGDVLERCHSWRSIDGMQNNRELILWLWDKVWHPKEFFFLKKKKSVLGGRLLFLI